MVDAAEVPLAPGTKPARLLQTLAAIARAHAPAAFATSLSVEDMVVTDALLGGGLDMEIFMIDTGRLHADTLGLLERIRRHYGYDVRVYAPDPARLERYVALHGRDAFYESVELRRACCHVRKVEPLARALAGKRAWVTGLRRTSSGTRARLPEREYDAVHGLPKFNPLAAWSESEVWDYVTAHGVPYNRLYDHGYRSIGCAPCTRPVVRGEDERAGRWWWEEDGIKECGLHPDGRGRLVRWEAHT